MKTAIICTMICMTGALVDTARARVGETKEECKERYGEASEGQLELGGGLEEAGAKWNVAVYSARGLEIRVVFEEDKAVFIRYSNKTVFSLETGGAPSVGLRPSEISFLKSANSGSKKGWVGHSDAFIKSVAPTLTVWRFSDRDMMSGYNREKKALFVCTKTFWDLVLGKVRERDDSNKGKNRLEGL